MLYANLCEVTVLVLLDLSATFDTVDDRILLARISTRVGISDTELGWFKSYLSKRTFSLISESYSSYTADPELASGMPQGSILGPVLALSFMLN